MGGGGKDIGATICIFNYENSSPITGKKNQEGNAMQYSQKFTQLGPKHQQLLGRKKEMKDILARKRRLVTVQNGGRKKKRGKQNIRKSE